MATPFIGQIHMFAFDFPPRNWAFCNGQLLPIAQNQALFSLLGTTYGGNGQTTFALPNLQGRTPLHFGTGPGLSPRTLGQPGGAEAVTLLTTQIPVHNHTVAASTAAPTVGTPAGNYWAQGNYSSTGNASMNPADVSNVGQGQAHENRSPYLVVNFSIALQGIFPPRN
jgi:microcystin-dependent protein